MTRVRTNRARRPRAVANVKARSVVATRAAGEGDPLDLIGIEQRRIRGSPKDLRQLPGQVDGITDAGVHPLAAGRAVDVRGVPKKKGAPLAKLIRYPVVNPVGRKPVHLLDLELQVLDRPGTDVVEGELTVVLALRVPHAPDEPDSPLALHGKGEQEVGLVEVDMQLEVGRGAFCFDIRDVEQALVGSPWKPNAERLAHGRMGPVAARYVGGFERPFLSVGCPQEGADACGFLLEPHQFEGALHLNPQALQLFDQQAFVGVLGEDQRKRKRGDRGPGRRKRNARRRAAAGPKVDGGDLDALFDQQIGKAQLSSPARSAPAG